MFNFEVTFYDVRKDYKHTMTLQAEDAISATREAAKGHGWPIPSGRSYHSAAHGTQQENVHFQYDSFGHQGVWAIALK
jgi:hypothetical protein